MSAPAPEVIVGIIPALLRRKGFMGLGSETFNLILTPTRLIFAAVSSETMKEAVALARQQARERGEGAFGQYAAQQGWAGVLSQQYETMSADAILARFSGSFCLTNDEIRQIKLRAAAADDDAPQTQAELSVEATGSKHKFEFSSQPVKEARRLLQQTLGSKVK